MITISKSALIQIIVESNTFRQMYGYIESLALLLESKWINEVSLLNFPFNVFVSCLQLKLRVFQMMSGYPA